MTLSPFDSRVTFVLCRQGEEQGFRPLPEYAPYLASMKHASRRQSFLLGRCAAYHALRQHGIVQPPAVLVGNYGMPLWPAGVVGSIAHTENIAVAAVAHAREIRSLGVDVEMCERKIDTGLQKRICAPMEIQSMLLDEQQAQKTLLRILSAKESLFKALYPLTSVWFGLRDAELCWDENFSTCVASLKKNLSQEFSEGWKTEIGIQSDRTTLVTGLAIYVSKA